MFTMRTHAPNRRGPLSHVSLGLFGALPIGLAALAVAPPASAQAQATTLYQFTGGASAGDGCTGSGSLILDSAGNLYGVTAQGGTFGNGSMFSLFPGSSTDVVLHSFQSYNPDLGSGSSPQGKPIFDSAGNLYGTTYSGGAFGFGTVFKQGADGSFKTLYSFTGGSDGGNPAAGLVADSAGNLYGTTVNGGIKSDSNYYLGTIFKISADTGSLTTLYRFAGGADGSNPFSDLIFDPEGNLYGTTSGDFTRRDLGTVDNFNFGTVFKLSSGGQLTTLHAFFGDDGAFPLAGVVFDRVGNLYGTTYGDSGGLVNGTTANGTVFELSPNGTVTVLKGFGDSDATYNPTSDLIFDSAGSLYGTTSNSLNNSSNPNGFAYAFRLSRNPRDGGHLTKFDLVATLPGINYKYSGGHDVYYANGLLTDSKGTLYGTTTVGGTEDTACGAIYSIAGVAAPGPTLASSPKSLTINSGDTQTVKVRVVKGGNYFPQTPLLTGPGASDFSITANGCAPPEIFHNGASCSITVAYNPSDVLPGQNSYASLNLTGNAALSISLTGVVPSPTLTATPQSLSFAANSFGDKKSVTIRVKGGLYFPEPPVVIGPNADQFTITSNSCTSVVTPTTSCSVALLYSGNSEEPAAASLHLSGTSTLDVPLSGKPAAPPLPCRLHPATCQ